MNRSEELFSNALRFIPGSSRWGRVDFGDHDYDKPDYKTKTPPEFHEEDALNIVLPAQVTLKITETEPALKGQTVSSSFKPATASNGLRIMVPQFINVEDDIVVETDERTYVKRAEK